MTYCEIPRKLDDAKISHFTVSININRINQYPIQAKYPFYGKKENNADTDETPQNVSSPHILTLQLEMDSSSIEKVGKVHLMG